MHVVTLGYPYIIIYILAITRIVGIVAEEKTKAYHDYSLNLYLQMFKEVDVA